MRKIYFMSTGLPKEGLKYDGLWVFCADFVRNPGHDFCPLLEQAEGI